MNELIALDLFCGGGGTTTGIIDVPGVKVAAAVNHDELAMATHKINHPETEHLTEDITDLERVIGKLKRIHYHYNIIWASVECTNYSNAKGGAPKDADSRTMPKCLIHYMKRFLPEYLIVENVKEFLSWGPLKKKYDKKTGLPVMRKDKKTGKMVHALEPDKKLNGKTYLQWVHRIKRLGYEYEYRLINSADLGAYTSRTRYFGVFRRIGLPMAWPEPTHAKKPEPGSGLKKWNACKEKLDLNNHGNSIFTRKKPLVENTLRRIAYGIQKYCDGDVFLAQYYGTMNAHDLDQPAATVTPVDRHAIVQFLSQAIWGNSRANSDIKAPSPAIMTPGENQIVTGKIFLLQNYNRINAENDSETAINAIPTTDTHRKTKIEFVSNGNSELSASEPSSPVGSITTQDRIQLVEASREDIVQFLVKQWTGPNVSSIEEPKGTIPTVDQTSQLTFMVENRGQSTARSINIPASTSATTGGAHKAPATIQFLAKYQGSNNTSDLDKPSPSILTSGQHLALCTINSEGEVRIITDIKMRFLTVQELKELQGFPADYVLLGNKRQQKKFIGNAVVPIVATAIVSAIKELQPQTLGATA